MPSKDKELIALSLFSSSGIGDLGLRASGIKTVMACELVKERASLFSANFPDAEMFQGDIWALCDIIIKKYRKLYKKPPFLILATPPCQGMSSNGMGTLLRNLKEGKRTKMDERNRLIIPAMKIIKALKPKWVIIENVPKMQETPIIDGNNNLVNIIDYIKEELGSSYAGCPEVVDAADYGVPQHRKRLITIMTRTAAGKRAYSQHHSLLPQPTNSKEPGLFTQPYKTLREAIGNLPRLEATESANFCDEIPLHRVPVLDNIKLTWIRNTPEGQTALNNQCINPECMYQENPSHGSKKDKNGVNRAKEDTPLYCVKCGSLLPRPYVIDKNSGEKRLMKAFTSAYKRMNWDEPASTLTQNFQYACSDNKIHPSQNRVLSLWEGMVLQTIADYDFSFEIDGRYVNDSIIRDTIGESIPPHLTELMCRHILNLSGMTRNKSK